MAFVYTLFGFNKISSRRQRLLVIATHFFGWLIFFTMPLLFFNVQISNPDFFIKEFINKLFLVAFFYLNYYYLLPAFLLKGKKREYIVLLVLCFVLLMIQQLIAEDYFFRTGAFSPRPGIHIPIQDEKIIDSFKFQPGMRIGPDHAFIIRPAPPVGSGLPGVVKAFFFRVFGGLISSVFFLLLLGGFIHLASSLFKSQSEKKILENANLTAENNLLKSQINPHFLFNTLNSIYAQALQKSDHTEKSILKLSEILRYMVYETGSEKILLQKDLYYISSYIDLQRLRLSTKVPIVYEVKGDIDGVYISPLLLITFIENAFKHGISFQPAAGINILIEVIEKILTLKVSNPIAIKQVKEEEGGIGQKNAKRRLDLLYPDRYWLNIATDNEIYSVILKLDLNQ